MQHGILRNDRLCLSLYIENRNSYVCDYNIYTQYFKVADADVILVVLIICGTHPWDITLSKKYVVLIWVTKLRRLIL